MPYIYTYFIIKNCKNFKHMQMRAEIFIHFTTGDQPIPSSIVFINIFSKKNILINKKTTYCLKNYFIC